MWRQWIEVARYKINPYPFVPANNYSLSFSLSHDSAHGIRAYAAGYAVPLSTM